MEQKKKGSHHTKEKVGKAVGTSIVVMKALEVGKAAATRTVD